MDADETTRIDIELLKRKARQLRLDVLEMTCKSGGHLSSCYSATEIMTAMYFGGILRYRCDEPLWPGRDRFIVSKGHAAPLLYAVLAEAGYFERDRLLQFRQIGSPFHGHPIQGSVPGVEITSGSLGQGLSFGLGHVMSQRLSGQDFRVYVLLGDGECEEGQIWEAAMASAHFKADRLTAIVDHNKYQQNGPISREMALEPFVQKWWAFGWHVQVVDGHDMPAFIQTVRSVIRIQKQPQVVIAHTVKGKGVSFVENDYTYHGREIPKHLIEKARAEILCV
jgi:transketolase